MIFIHGPAKCPNVSRIRNKYLGLQGEIDTQEHWFPTSGSWQPTILNKILLGNHYSSSTIVSVSANQSEFSAPKSGSRPPPVETHYLDSREVLLNKTYFWVARTCFI